MNIQQQLASLKPGDYIAFVWKYGTFGEEIVVDNITEVYDNDVLVHFLYGYKSEAEFVKKEDIIAIGNPNGTGKIKGWTGNFDILKPDHPLLK